jgi:hypothetical protein
MEIIKSKSPNKSDKFDNKPLSSNGMNGFGHKFGDVGENGFSPFSMSGNKIFPAGAMLAFGIAFSGRPQVNTVIGGFHVASEIHSHLSK